MINPAYKYEYETKYDGTEFEGLTFEERSELKREMIRFHLKEADRKMKSADRKMKRVERTTFITGVSMVVVTLIVIAKAIWF